MVSVFALLEKLETSGTTDLRQACRQFASRPRPKGLTIVISDFLDPQGTDAGLKLLRTLGHDVLVVHVRSQLDRDPGSLGEVHFEDAETGEGRDLDVTPQLAAAYASAWLAHDVQLAQFCERYEVGYLRADAERPFEDVVMEAFRQGRFVA